MKHNSIISMSVLACLVSPLLVTWPPAPAMAADGAGDSLAAVADSSTAAGYWELGGKRVPKRLVGPRFRQFVSDSLAINRQAVLALHAEPRAAHRTAAQVAAKLVYCDSLRTAIQPGDWEIFVVAAGYDQIAGASFSLEFPEDWEVRGFRASPDLESPIMMGGLRSSDARPRLIAFSCIGHPEHRDLLLPHLAVGEAPVVVIGSLDVTATSAGSIALAAHSDARYGQPEMVSCFSTSVDVAGARLGRIDVGRGPGRRPCAAGATLGARGGAAGASVAAGTAAPPAGDGAAPPAGAAAAADDPVVVRVGTHEQRRSQFDEGFSRFERDTSLTLAENRKVYLGSVIDRYLLLSEAEERGFFAPDAQNKAYASEYEDYLVSERVRQEDVRSKVMITDADVRDFYDKHAVLYDVSQIIVPTEEEAWDLVRRLRAGAGFEQLARERSVDAKSRLDGGHLKPFVWGATSTWFISKIAALAPGTISDPVRSDFGYHIFRVNAVTPRKQQPFEERKQFMASQLSMRRQGEIQRSFYAGLRADYGAELHLDVARALAAIYVAQIDRAEQAEPEAGIDHWAEVAIGKIEVPDSLLAQPLVSWGDGGRYTVQDSWEYMRALPAAIIIDRRNPRQILIDGLVEFYRAAIIRRGRERGYQNDPGLRAKVDLKREELALTRFYQQQIIQSATFTEEDERRYYDENRDRYTTPAAVRVARVRYRSREAAVEGEQAFQAAGVEPDSVIARQEAAGLVVSQEKQSGWLTTGQDAPLLGRTAALEPGAVGRYIDPDGYWTVFVLLEKQEGGTRSFEDARSSIRKALQTIRSEEVLNEFLGVLKSKFDVWVDPSLESP